MLVENESIARTGVACFLIRGNKFYMHKRLVGHGKGEFSIPGGKPNFGERLRNAVVREVEEETGVILTFRQLRYLGAVTASWPELTPQLHYVTNVYATRLFDEQPDPEVKELKKAAEGQWWSLTAQSLPKPTFKALWRFWDGDYEHTELELRDI